MAKFLKPSDKDIAAVRAAFKSSPELAHLAPHVRGGFEVLNFAFAVMDKAQTVKGPVGIEVGEISVRAKNPNSKKANGEVDVAIWMLEALKKAINYDEEKS